MSSAGRRILVVDDNRDSAESLAKLLDLQGHDTATAHDGMGALELAETFRPDVIVLDVGLPQMDGNAVARHIRGTTWGRHILLIASTGWGHTEARQRSAEAGFDHHLVKPVDLGELARLISDAAVPEGPD
jgi:CheY-like chemotaxis protein